MHLVPLPCEFGLLLARVQHDLLLRQLPQTGALTGAGAAPDSGAGSAVGAGAGTDEGTCTGIDAGAHTHTPRRRRCRRWRTRMRSAGAGAGAGAAQASAVARPRPCAWDEATVHASVMSLIISKFFISFVHTTAL